jgi:adenylosuccinate lyase
MRSFSEQRDFKALLQADPDVTRVLSAQEIDRAFDLGEQLKHVDDIFERVFNKASVAEAVGVPGARR